MSNYTSKYSGAEIDERLDRMESPLPVTGGGTGATSREGALMSFGIEDYIVEQGTSGIWTYRKWNSGIAECWGETTKNFSITAAWGNLYLSSGQYTSENYPFTFKELPMCFETHNGNGYSVIPVNESYPGTTTSTPHFQFARPNTNSSIDVTTQWYAIGKWK